MLGLELDFYAAFFGHAGDFLVAFFEGVAPLLRSGFTDAFDVTDGAGKARFAVEVVFHRSGAGIGEQLKTSALDKTTHQKSREEDRDQNEQDHRAALRASEQPVFL